MTDSYAPLTDDQLLKLLATEEDRLPRAAVDEFVARGERMIPPLTRILEDKASWWDEGPAYWRPVHAAYILGAIGGERAIPGLLAAFEHAAEADVVWVDEDLPSIFGRIGSPAVGPLIEWCREAESDTSWRRSGFLALGTLALHHAEPRAVILDYLRSVADDESEPEQDRLIAAGELLSFARPEDLKTLLAAAKRAERHPDLFFNREDINQAYEPDRPQPSEKPWDWLEFYSPAQIAKRQEQWKEEGSPADAEQEDASDFMEPDDDDAPPPLRADPASAGRNDPCPCGSGKKFKKCCEK